jgi:hypothetical protein
MENRLDKTFVDFSSSARDALYNILKNCSIQDVLEGIKDYSLLEESVYDASFVFNFGTCDFIVKDGQLIVFRK